MVNLTISGTDRNELQRLEEELWIDETRFDRPYMEKVMANDFFEFGRSGRVYEREDTLTIDKGSIDAVIPLPNFKIRLLTDDVAQVTYDSAVTYDGVVEKGRRSSIWTRAGNSWLLRLHQGTVY